MLLPFLKIEGVNKILFGESGIVRMVLTKKKFFLIDI